MSRLNILVIGLGILIVGGGVYGGIRLVGVDGQTAQLWASVGLLVGFVAWVIGYLTRVVSGSMTFHEQRQTYQKELLRQRIESMTPEEFAAFEAELVAEEDPASAPSESS